MIRFESGQIGPSLASRQGFNISSTSAPDSVIRGEQNGTGNDWSGQDLSQEAEHVCLRRYPPAPNGTVIAVGRKNSIGVSKQAPGTHGAIRPRPALR
jgi:hypothetical protein